jgi:hypothetical protein
MIKRKLYGRKQSRFARTALTVIIILLGAAGGITFVLASVVIGLSFD